MPIIYSQGGLQARTIQGRCQKSRGGIPVRSRAQFSAASCALSGMTWGQCAQFPGYSRGTRGKSYHISPISQLPDSFFFTFLFPLLYRAFFNRPVNIHTYIRWAIWFAVQRAVYSAGVLPITQSKGKTPSDRRWHGCTKNVQYHFHYSQREQTV